MFQAIRKGLNNAVSLALALSVAALLALGAAVAQAETPRLVSLGNFPAHLPMGVAVDPSSGDVFVTSFFEGGINKFDTTGKRLAPPSPFGAGSGFYSDTAVNPINGDVYVLDAASHAIETYDPGTGALLSSFEVPESDNLIGFTFVQIATDSAGNVYVPVVPDNEVLEYSSAGALLNTFTGSGAGALKQPTGVAIDSSGDVWVGDSGNNRIEELSPTDAFIREIKSEGVGSVALDSHGDVLAIVDNGADFCGGAEPPCSHLVEYGPAGAQLADVGAGRLEPPEGLRLPSTLAVNESNDHVYVTAGGGELVLVFGPPVAPTVGKELAVEVSTSEAKLGALVNPGGAETSYRFEYDTREYREGEASHGQATPFPEGSAGEGLTPRTVWAAASRLAPGTTYHYRVVATNELGVAFGPDQTFTTETAAQAACPNEQLRGGFSARLPDCRAYELVTPPFKTSVQYDVKGAEHEVAPDGDRIPFNTREPLPGAPTGGTHYLAIRGAGGWTSEDMNPPQSYSAPLCSQGSSGVAYARDLSETVVTVGADTRGAGQCNAEGVEVVSGEPLGYQNLLLRDNSTTYQLINVPPPGVIPADAVFEGGSSDFSHVIFGESVPLTPNASVGVGDLYEWDEGVLRLVTVLPDGAPVEGSLVEAQEGLEGQEDHAVSTDGSHVFFTAGGDLYVRLNGSSTVQIDASQAGGAGGGGVFWAASSDGSRVFFSDDAAAGLTGGTAPGSGQNLYEYNLESGVLTDLTAAGKVNLQKVVGVSEDGSYVYFSAQSSLAPGAVNGQNNLYLRHGGVTTLVATLAEGKDHEGEFVNTRTAPDGLWFAFATSDSLTGYDNLEPEGTPAQELFLYNATSTQLVCASCNPSGEAPVDHGGFASSVGLYLSDGGLLFFETPEALLPSDTNGQIDVYEYEDGVPRLISGGTSASESNLIGANENGEDVFFLSRQQLVPQDTEGETLVIYDARVDGGFPTASSPPPCTTADACRAASSPQPLIYGAPASQTFEGAGNVSPLPPTPSVRPRALTRAQKLMNTLAACKKDKSKSKRMRCERTARKLYAKAKKATAKKSNNDRRASR